ncbi:MAG: CHAT domain-containing protein, partial [Planctomycetota bacterium]
ILERGRARAALDLLERSGRDLAAEAAALGDAQRSRRLAEAQAAEEQIRIDLTSTEKLLAGRRKERDTLERRQDLDAEVKARQLADYDQQIAALLKEVKRKRQALTQAGGAVLTELRGLFPAGKALTTGEILRGLSPDEAVVSFAWGGDSVLVATAASGKTGAVIVANDKEAVKRLSELAGQVRNALDSRPSPGADLDPAATRNLVTTLLPESVRSAVAGVRRLIVLPDGPLNDIPLEVLAEAVPNSMLADAEIVYAPSATLYLDRSARGRSSCHG